MTHGFRASPFNRSSRVGGASLLGACCVVAAFGLGSPHASHAKSTKKQTSQAKVAPRMTGRTRAKETVATLRLRSPRLAVEWRWSQPGPQLVAGLAAQTRGANPEARARHFLRDHEALLGGVRVADLRLDHISEAKGRQVARFAQSWRSLPVLGRFVAVSLDTDGTVRHFSSDAAPIKRLKRGATAKAVAARKALLAVAAPGQQWRVHTITEVVDITPTGAVHGYAVDVMGSPKAKVLRVVVRSIDGAVQRITDRLVH